MLLADAVVGSKSIKDCNQMQLAGRSVLFDAYVHVYVSICTRAYSEFQIDFDEFQRNS